MHLPLGAALVLLLAGLSARAQEFNEAQVLLGFEPTATNREIRATNDGDLKTKMKREVLERFLLRAPDAKHVVVEKESGWGRSVEEWVEWKGRKWTFGTDPGVVEVQPPPMRFGEIKTLLTPLYQAFADAGLTTYYPRETPGYSQGTGGHIHVDDRVFRENPLLLRNLLADIHNRPYLAAIFNDPLDHANARSLFENGLQNGFLKLIRELDAAAIRKGGYEFETIREKVISLYGTNWASGSKFVEVNLEKGRPSVEFRFFCGQATVADIESQARLLLRYLHRLSLAKGPIPPRKFTAEEWQRLRGPERARREFERLVRKLGLDPKDYRKYTEVRSLGPIRKAEGTRFLEIRHYDVTREMEVTRHFYEVLTTRSVARVVVDGKEIPLRYIPGTQGLMSGTFESAERQTYKLEAYDKSGKLIEGLVVNRISEPAKPVARPADRRAPGSWVPGGPPRETRQAMEMQEWFGRIASDFVERPAPPGQQERGSRTSRAVRTVKGEAAGLGQFAGAFLIKEAGYAALEGKPDRLVNAASGMPTPEFLGSLGMFAGIAHGVGRVLDHGWVKDHVLKRLPGGAKGVARALTRTYLPLAVAIPAVEYAFGERDAAKIARSTAIFTAIGAATDLPVLLGMIAVPGPGTIFGAAYFTVKLAAVLFLSEAIDEYLEGRGPIKDAERKIRGFVSKGR